MHVGRLAAVTAGLSALAAVLVVGLPGRSVEASPPPFEGARAVEAWPGVAFNEPIALAHANDGSDTLYVLEQPGILKRIQKYRGVGEVPKPEVVLDLKATGKVVSQGQGGALGLAFHPLHKQNGRFYVSYLTKNQHPTQLFKMVVSEFRMFNGTTSPATERIVLEVPKTRAIHQAGGIAFGPDRKLYIGVGENGAENDKPDSPTDPPMGNAQNPAVLLGKILRIDVDNPPAGKAYGTGNNPWANNPGVRPEIWAYGFRNPWRFSWDAQGNMFVGEPGSKGPKCREWITQVVRGGNHGWPYMEGNTRNPGRTDMPVGTVVIPRTFDYGREDPESGSCAIGGQVYRGDRIKSLQGKYVFADYMLEELYVIDLAKKGETFTGTNWRKVASVKAVSIDTDAQGELYFCVNEKADLGGTIMTLAPK
jgi:glucose/arabinose dehydrogenase